MRDRQHSFAEFTAYATRFIRLTIVVGTMVLYVVEADAQSTTVIGGHGNPSVEVDLSVLNSLPQKPTLPQLLYPGLKSQGSRLSKWRPLSHKPTRYRRRPIPATPPTRPSISSTPLPATITTKPAGKPRTTATIREDQKPAAETASAMLGASQPTVKSSTTKTTPPLKVLPPQPTKSKLKQSANMPTKIASTASAPKTSITAQTSGLTLRILFDEGASTLANSMATKLDDLVRELKTNKTSRLQLVAYATATDGSASKARRLSLSRALSVRAYLMDQGVKSTRMDVRALGSRSSSSPTDWVDVVMTP